MYISLNIMTVMNVNAAFGLQHLFCFWYATFSDMYRILLWCYIFQVCKGSINKYGSLLLSSKIKNVNM